MAEWKHLIEEWLVEYETLKPPEIRSYAAEHEHNHEIATAIHGLLGEAHFDQELGTNSETCDHCKVLESVCIQLFSFYRSKEPEMQRFTLQFVPVFIYTYLSSVARGNKWNCHFIETLLIGIYNIEVIDDEGKPKVVAFRLPSLAQASIYHEPLSLAPQFLTENALRRWEECNSKLVSWGPMQQVEVLNAQNRLKVMSALLFVYNQNLSALPKMSLRYLCSAASRLVNEGFYPMTPSTGPGRGSDLTNRIQLSLKFLLELTHSVYFAMFNEFYTLALEVINDIERRACYELQSEVMLVTRAIINSSKANAASQPCDGLMGISVALTPATNTVTMSKSMITNASFRTKKLPDDIPIQASETLAEGNEALTSIMEEGETEGLSQRGNILRASKPKQLLSGLKKLKEGKDKTSANKNGTDQRKVVIKDAKNKGDGDNTSPVPQTKADLNLGANGTFNDDRISIDSSDIHSQITSDSLEMADGGRIPTMQVTQAELSETNP